MTIFSWLLIAATLFCPANPSACSPFDIKLTDLHGNAAALNTFSTGPAVFVFLLPDCPACQNYSLTLNNLAKKYPRFKFIGVVPGNMSTNEEISSFEGEYKISFPVYRDDFNHLVRCLGATVVPEAFLVSGKEIVYSGRIDDWMVALGKKKLAVTQHDLADAIESLSKHQPVKVKRTKAIGCFIE